VFACVIALNERNFRAVRTPLNRLRAAAGDSALGENLFNGELLGRGVLRGHRGNESQQVDGDDKKKLLHERTPVQHDV
jgi:hypothetical protein